MPPHHRQFGEWTPERIVNWSKTVGPNTANLVQKIMTKKVHPEQAFRACMGIIRLSKSYTKQRVENASKRALTYGAISYQSILSILQKNLDLEVIPEQTQSQPLYHENIRGSHYYTGEAN
jgi:transposase